QPDFGLTLHLSWKELVGLRSKASGCQDAHGNHSEHQVSRVFHGITSPKLSSLVSLSTELHRSRVVRRPFPGRASSARRRSLTAVRKRAQSCGCARSLAIALRRMNRTARSEIPRFAAIAALLISSLLLT